MAANPRAPLVLAGAVAVAAAAAGLLGRTLAVAAVMGGRSILADLAHAWPAAPAALVLALALALAARAGRRAWLVLTLLAVVAAGAWGGWSGLSERVEAWREGPLNAAL